MQTVDQKQYITEEPFHDTEYLIGVFSSSSYISVYQTIIRKIFSRLTLQNSVQHRLLSSWNYCSSFAFKKKVELNWIWKEK